MLWYKPGIQLPGTCRVPAAHLLYAEFCEVDVPRQLQTKITAQEPSQYADIAHYSCQCANKTRSVIYMLLLLKATFQHMALTISHHSFCNLLNTAAVQVE